MERQFLIIYDISKDNVDYIMAKANGYVNRYGDGFAFDSPTKIRIEAAYQSYIYSILIRMQWIPRPGVRCGQSWMSEEAPSRLWILNTRRLGGGHLKAGSQVHTHNAKDRCAVYAIHKILLLLVSFLSTKVASSDHSLSHIKRASWPIWQDLFFSFTIGGPSCHSPLLGTGTCAV